MVTYKYLKSSQVTNQGKTLPRDDYIRLFQETLDDQFYNASNVWTITEETSNGSKEYQNVDVRIAHLINAETGLKLGDDWKTLLFQDVNHDIELGRHYVFNDNTWLTVNTEIVKNLTGTCTIRRCNNTLRWIDEPTGALYEEPCCIEYLVKEPRDYYTSGSPITTPGGFLHIEMQFNERSNLINENQRFLFGNPSHWTCYKVVGTGINDFRNTTTYDNSTAKILSLDLVANFINEELDDITNGIADVYTNVYVFTLNQDTAQGSAGSTLQLSTSITYNGDNVTRTVTWETSSVGVATVSTTGLVTFVGNGTCTITAHIENNPDIYDTCAVTVTASPTVNSEVVISPNTNYVLEGKSRTYSVYLYQDGTQKSNKFTITCNRNSVPAANYTFTQTGDNGFIITNILRDVSSYLTITCASTTGGFTKTYNVYLRGAWQFDKA